MLEFEHIIIKEIGQTTNTSVFQINNKKSEMMIGLIKWNSFWRGYCFFPEPNTIYNTGCLKDILNFIEIETEKRRK